MCVCVFFLALPAFQMFVKLELIKQAEIGEHIEKLVNQHKQLDCSLQSCSKGLNCKTVICNTWCTRGYLLLLFTTLGEHSCDVLYLVIIDSPSDVNSSRNEGCAHQVL